MDKKDEENVVSSIFKEAENLGIKWDKEDIDKENKRLDKFNKKCKKTILKAIKNKEKETLVNLYNEYGPEKKNGKGIITMTKKLMIFIIINCSVIEIYSMYVMYHFQDLSILSSLISAVVAETMSFLFYCVKSYFENKSEKNTELEYYRIDNQNDKSDLHNNYTECEDIIEEEQ